MHDLHSIIQVYKHTSTLDQNKIELQAVHSEIIGGTRAAWNATLLP